MVSKAIEKGLKELREIRKTYEEKVIKQEKWAENYNVLFFIFISVLFLSFLLIPDLIYLLLFGLICFTEELCALTLGIGLIGISPGNKSREMREKLDIIDSAIDALGAGRTSDAYGIWTSLVLGDGLENKGKNIIRELWVGSPLK